MSDALQPNSKMQRTARGRIRQRRKNVAARCEKTAAVTRDAPQLLAAISDVTADNRSRGRKQISQETFSIAALLLFFGDQIFINIFAALLLLIAIFPSAINFLVTLGRGWWIIEFRLPAHQVFISLCKRTVIKI